MSPYNNQAISFLRREISRFLDCDEDTVSLYLKTFEAPISINEYPNWEDKLDYLSSLCLISDYTDSKNNFFFPVDPQYSFPAIILREMWSTDFKLQTLSDLKKREDLIDLNIRYKQCTDIVKELRYSYKKQLPFLKKMAITVQGYQRIASYISELLETANDEILAVVSPPHLLGEIVWQTIVERMKNGVSYKRITTFDEINRHGYEIARKEIQDYNETLYIYNNESLPEKFFLINNIIIAFFIPDLRNKDFKSEVQIINNNGLTKAYIKTFNRLKNDCINLNDLIVKIGRFRSHFLSMTSQVLSALENKWLTEVFDYGVFTIPAKHKKEVIESAINKCLSNNWITVSSKEIITTKYSLQDVLNYENKQHL